MANRFFEVRDKFTGRRIRLLDCRHDVFKFLDRRDPDQYEVFTTHNQTGEVFQIESGKSFLEEMVETRREL